MSEPDKSAARWMPFQCPACFALFRLQRGNLGSKGHCPQCQEVLAVPDVRKPIPQSVGEVKKAQPVAKTIAVAQTVDPEVAKSWNEDKGQRRRVYVGESEEMNQWEGVDREDGKSYSWMVVCSCVLMFAVFSAVGIHLFKNAPSKKGNASPVVINDAVSAAALENSLLIPENKSYLNEKGENVIEKSIDKYAEFDLLKIEAVVKGFLESDTVEERLAFVRTPEVVKPMMVEYYGAGKFEPEGFEEFNRTEVRYRGSFLTSFARIADFSTGPIAVERIEKDGQVSYLVDWESWVGYCESSVEDLMRLKPTDPVLLRIMVRKGSYYNYAFSDDQIWSAHRLTFRNSDRTLLAYIRRDSKDHEALDEILEKTESMPYTIKVRYPENARSGDQVEIVELVTQGWIENLKDVEVDDE